MVDDSEDVGGEVVLDSEDVGGEEGELIVFQHSRRWLIVECEMNLN